MHRFSSSLRTRLAPIVLGVLFASSVSPGLAIAQGENLIAPIDIFNPPNVAQPIDFSPYENPDVTGDGVPDNPDLRKGACCIPSEFDRVHGCVWGVGLDLQGQDAFEACRTDLGGIHYVQGNLTPNVPDKSWEACSIQCGKLSKVYFCDPTTYTFSQAYPSDPTIRWEDVITCDNPQDCEYQCHAPVDLETTAACSCSRNGDVTCDIDVYQNPLTVDTDSPAITARVSQITVTLGGNDGTLTLADDALTYDDQGNPTGDVINAEHAEGDLQTLVFTGENGPFAIPGASTTYEGGGFHAQVHIPALAYDSELEVITAQDRQDPNTDNDIARAHVPSANRCSVFTLQTQCRLEYDGSASTAADVGLYHHYALSLEDTDQESHVVFSIDPHQEGSCLDADTIRMSDAFDDLCETGQGTISCTIPPDTFKSIGFTIRPLDDTDCPIGTPIPVTATVTVGTRPAETHTINENLGPCGKCDICGHITDENACHGMDAFGDNNGIAYCSWELAEDGQEHCVSNDDNPACSVWYAACINNVPESSADETRFVYAGRIGVDANETPIYWPTAAAVAAGDSEFDVATQAMFDEAKSCNRDPEQPLLSETGEPVPGPDGLPMNKCDFTGFWHELPDETFYYEDVDDSYDGPVALDYKACLGDDYVRRRGNGSKSSQSSAGREDWYCSYRFDDVIIPDQSLASLATPVARPPCEIFGTQPLSEGTVYDSGSYSRTDNPQDPQQAALLRCPETCATVTQHVGTCYVAAMNSCQHDYDLQDCINVGGMFFTNGPLGQETCRQSCGNGLCDPGNIPADWQLPQT